MGKLDANLEVAWYWEGIEEKNLNVLTDYFNEIQHL